MLLAMRRASSFVSTFAILIAASAVAFHKYKLGGFWETPSLHSHPHQRRSS